MGRAVGLADPHSLQSFSHVFSSFALQHHLALHAVHDPERVPGATAEEPRGSGAERGDDCCPVRVDQATLDDPLLLVSNSGLAMKGFSTT